MNKVLLQVEREHNWTHEHAIKVANEYLKFMKLRNLNPKLSPSNEIDRFWHQHILNTKHYREFCIKNFNKFIDHDPEDANDQIARTKRVGDTIVEYKKKYSDNAPSGIWPTNTSEKIRVKLIYTFDYFHYSNGVLGSEGTWHRVPRNDMGRKYDRKIITVEKKGTIDTLTKFIVKVIGHTPMKIKPIYNFNEYNEGECNTIDKNKKLSELPDDIVFVLEEPGPYC